MKNPALAWRVLCAPTAHKPAHGQAMAMAGNREVSFFVARPKNQGTRAVAVAVGVLCFVLGGLCLPGGGVLGGLGMGTLAACACKAGASFSLLSVVFLLLLQFKFKFEVPAAS
jgi:hypothetical protein